MSKTTMCPARTWTRSPGPGNLLPIKVFGSDHRPLFPDRIRESAGVSACAVAASRPASAAATAGEMRFMIAVGEGGAGGGWDGVIVPRHRVGFNTVSV